MDAVLDLLPLKARVAPPRRLAAGDDVPEETWILERCAGEIALEAGPGTRVVELGGRSSGGVDLLEAAIEALAGEPAAATTPRRRLVFVSAARTGAMAEPQLAATLRRVREISPDDALLVVAAASPRADSLARFERLTSAAAWEHRQLWSDGRARVAVHVLAGRAGSSRSTHM